MVYLLCYLAIGLAIAFLMAYLQKRRTSANFENVSWKMMLGAYVFIALAWPVSIAAFIFGALSQFILGPQQ